MANQLDFTPIRIAVAKIGGTLLAQHEKELEHFLEPLADADANTVIKAIADHVELHGLAGMAQAPIKGALTGAIPTIDDMINKNIENGFDGLTKLVASFAK